jgi:hypothetical protein
VGYAQLWLKSKVQLARNVINSKRAIYYLSLQLTNAVGEIINVINHDRL